MLGCNTAEAHVSSYSRNISIKLLKHTSTLYLFQALFLANRTFGQSCQRCKGCRHKGTIRRAHDEGECTVGGKKEISNNSSR